MTVVAAISIAAPATGVDAARSLNVPTSSDGFVANPCAEGVIRILPGDYYACHAVYAMKHRDYRKAMDLLLTSAQWANKNSQRVLGLVHFYGDSTGIRPDHALGLAWLQLAAERKDPDIRADYDKARGLSSAAELAHAATLFDEMKNTYGDAVAGVRAVQRYNQVMQPMIDANRTGNRTVFYGFGPYGQDGEVIVRRLNSQAAADFQGLDGTVTVGAIEPPPASASSTARP